jgi:hypothetical protein
MKMRKSTCSHAAARIIMQARADASQAGPDYGLMYRSMDRLASRTGMLLCAAWIAAAEQPVTRLYTTGDGLARNSVQRIRRDQRGRLWFCTVEGLSLFDGQKFYNYDTTDGLPHRNVTDILDAGDGFYWLATSGGSIRCRCQVCLMGRRQRCCSAAPMGRFGAARRTHCSGFEAESRQAAS